MDKMIYLKPKIVQSILIVSVLFLYNCKGKTAIADALELSGDTLSPKHIRLQF